MADDLRRYQLINGIPADLWVVREKEIAQFIARHRLKPALRRTLGVSKATTAKSMIAIDQIIDIRGGRKVPHLHYKGEIYYLKAKQWREFSGAVLKDLSKRLSESQQVSFNELLDISDSVGSVMR